METAPSLLSLNVALGVLLVDILLSGDNAIVIALVCRTLSKEHRTKALWLGVFGAFLARLVLTSTATLVMKLPLIKLIGGALLLKIAIELIVNNLNEDTKTLESQHSSAEDIFAAAKTIVLADIVMSLDNVLALSAITQNNWSMLVGGLLLSIPILMFGSLYISRLLDVFPYFLWAGGAILGGVSGALMIDDPIFDGAFNNAASIASLIVPILAAAFVVQISKVIAANARKMLATPKPPSLFNIIWSKTSSGAVLKSANQESFMETSTSIQSVKFQPAAAETVSVLVLAAPIEPKPVQQPKSKVPPSTAKRNDEHRVIAALGLFMVVCGSTLYYMLNVLQPSVPNGFINYVCKAPYMTISFLPKAEEIRFATGKGVIKTVVVDDRVTWDDYRDAGVKLSIAPPTKIISVDMLKLVVNGGMFDNTSCYSTQQ